ncbi:MAG: tetratricopeptide repeat protein [Sulfurimonas sp.]|nr:tetratricopeptide repeat protein [Sulfurimonas sp.]
MTLFQLLMLGASAFFAFKLYEHVQTLQEPKNEQNNTNPHANNEQKSADTFSPFSPEALVEKADIAFEEKEFERALALLNEANAKEPNNNEILFKIAYILQKSGDNNGALKYYKEALVLDKNNEFIHNSMASIYRENGEFTSAKMHLKDSLEIDGENPITYYNYGNLLVDMEHNEEAIEMYKKAMELNPEFDEAKVELEKLQG